MSRSIKNIDLNDKKLILPDRPNISFDLLSLNIGSEPNLSMIPGSQDHAIGIKPLPTFLELWPQLLQRAISTLTQKEQFKFAIVGGGPASVELAFSIQHRIENDLNLKSKENIPNYCQRYISTINLLHND